MIKLKFVFIILISISCNNEKKMTRQFVDKFKFRYVTVEVIKNYKLEINNPSDTQDRSLVEITSEDYSISFRIDSSYMNYLISKKYTVDNKSKYVKKIHRDRKIKFKNVEFSQSREFILWRKWYFEQMINDQLYIIFEIACRDTSKREVPDSVYKDLDKMIQFNDRFYREKIIN